MRRSTTAEWLGRTASGEIAKPICNLAWDVRSCPLFRLGIVQPARLVRSDTGCDDERAAAAALSLYA